MKEAARLLTDRIFNHSFCIGHFPSKWKHAVVKPFLKKLGARNRHLQISDRSQICRSYQKYWSVLPTMHQLSIWLKIVSFLGSSLPTGVAIWPRLLFLESSQMWSVIQTQAN